MPDALDVALKIVGFLVVVALALGLAAYLVAEDASMDRQAEDAIDRLPNVNPYIAPPPRVIEDTPPPPIMPPAPPARAPAASDLPAAIARDPDVVRDPTIAVELDDQQVRPGFGPAIRFKTLPDGTIVRR